MKKTPKATTPPLVKGQTVTYWPSPFSEEDEVLKLTEPVKAVVTHINHLAHGVVEGTIGAANVNLNLLIDGKAPIERKSVSFAKENGCSRSFTLIDTLIPKK